MQMKRRIDAPLPLASVASPDSRAARLNFYESPYRAFIRRIEKGLVGRARR